MSDRLKAQFGVFAAILVILTSLSILVVKGNNTSEDASNGPAVATAMTPVLPVSTPIATMGLTIDSHAGPQH